jgi:hypothetical protein
MPKPPGPGENVAAASANAQQSARRKALMAQGLKSTMLTRQGGTPTAPGGKTLLGS